MSWVRNLGDFILIFEIYVISYVNCIDDHKLILLLLESYTNMYYKPSLLFIDMSYPSIDMIGSLIAMVKMFVTSLTFTGAVR